MDRRGFVVATVAAAATGSVAGCLSRDDEENGETIGVDATVSLSDDILELPRDELIVETTNRGDAEILTTPTTFVVTKRTEDGFVWIYPPSDVFRRDGPAATVEPGDSITQEIEVSNDTNFDGGAYSIGGIGPGEYRVEHAYQRGEYLYDEFDAPSATFEVVGKPPELEPVDVVDVEREGGEVTVRTDWNGDGEATLRPKGGNAPPLVLEQVFRIPLLRNLLYYAQEKDAETVTVENLAATVRQMNGQLDLMSKTADSEYDGMFSYDGTTYEIEVTD